MFFPTRTALLLVAILPIVSLLQCSQSEQAQKNAAQKTQSSPPLSSTPAATPSDVVQQEHRQHPKTTPKKPAKIAEFLYDADTPADYQWTTNHMHIGVRWQPYGGRPENNAYDAARPIISKYSSYAQFWVAWSASEPNEQSTNYAKHISDYLHTIEQAVDSCIAQGLKCEFVFWHCPAWAAVGGKAGGVQAKPGLYPAFVERIARHFKGRVHAYQLAH